MPDREPYCERERQTDADSYFFQSDAVLGPPQVLHPRTCVSLPSHNSKPSVILSTSLTNEPSPISPPHSPSASPHITPSSSYVSVVGTHRIPLSRSSTSPRPRRRSSQQRVSLIAGQVSIAPMEHPELPPVLSPSLHRTGSPNSVLSMATSAGPPSPSAERESFLGGRSISEFTIEAEIGRGAYGLVKRAREIFDNGTLGVSLVVNFNFSTSSTSPIASFGYQTNYQVPDTS
jgi:protein-serine/threonine kinase